MTSGIVPWRLQDYELDAESFISTAHVTTFFLVHLA